MKNFTLLGFCLFAFILNAQTGHRTAIKMEPGEYWWGGVVAWGSKMPYSPKAVRSFDLSLQNENNQVTPLFLSNKGRYIWSNSPFRFEIKDSVFYLDSPYEDIVIQQGGKTLKEAYRTASAKHFPPTGSLPDALFFTMPQYNTWIELM